MSKSISDSVLFIEIQLSYTQALKYNIITQSVKYRIGDKFDDPSLTTQNCCNSPEKNKPGFGLTTGIKLSGLNHETKNIEIN